LWLGFFAFNKAIFFYQLSEAIPKIKNRGENWMNTVIRKLTPTSIKLERARLLRKARVNSVIELRRKVNNLQASAEQQGILMRLDGLSFLEGSKSKAS
jgi:hypothetical protein